jgi:hypothetical protein
VQGGLFATPPPARDKLLQAMDRIRDRHGEHALHHGVLRTVPGPNNDLRGGAGASGSAGAPGAPDQEG